MVRYNDVAAFTTYGTDRASAYRLLEDALNLRDIRIKVYENGNISVRFKFADEFRRIAEYIEINTTKPAVAG